MSRLPRISTFQLSGDCIAAYSVNPSWNADNPSCLKSAFLSKRLLKSSGPSRRNVMKSRASGRRPGTLLLDPTPGTFFMWREETQKCALKNCSITWEITGLSGKNTISKEKSSADIGMGASAITKTTIELRVISIQKSSCRKTASFSASTSFADFKSMNRNANDE